MILVIDNYDSFVHNLARYFRQLGQETVVRRNDAISVEEIKQIRPVAIVLSPGPCTPTESGICMDVVRQLQSEIPILGVCLGHQAIVEALGGRVVRSNRPMHGQASQITHDGTGVFRELPSPMQVGRYHSLIAEKESLPACLRIDAQTEDGTIMAVSHPSLPVVGVQFHPESVLTEHGYALLANFLQMAGLASPPKVNVAMPKIAIPGGAAFAEGDVYWSQEL
ncbi:aminodeoxychorismate/anthranilate synthase component II [Blastopirellula marina]|uniref:Aminodeoxychorismate/anthranilate synthase component II n=1 Tax=Blastopirellula marina TaxID=124 RepID=A0A2S8FSX0_9BACT|nr:MULTISPECIES: aminodeoxychorismate/anthranilate synthase component II [Pirellulaceae]PQO35279.1 aminodeoxychorismate/anthranilate synthase component II [Blastopirellula marina]RCS53148.1 aminodeoxychorismate/anthranilate synthase component II [Bremerella cremea]